MKAETTRLPDLPAWARALRMKWTRQRCQVAQSTLDTAALIPSCASEITSLMYITDWLDNGGDSVIQEADPGCTARKLVDLAEIARAAVGDAFLHRVRTGPTWHAEGDLLFVHAGVDPHQDIATFLDKPRLLAMDDDQWAWIREPFLDWNKGWNGRVIIHGHTPAIRRPCDHKTFADEADRISTQRRLCLDAGAAFLPQLGWAEFRADDYRLCLTTLF